MAQAVSFGQITITDLTDIGTLSVYPTANQPLSVIYNPDQNSYTPNWATSNLVITPVVYYGGTQLTSTSSGCTITWTRQEGSAGATALTTGESVSNGILSVTANKFTSSSTMISYIVHVTYVEPDTHASLQAEGKITFSLAKQSSSVKTASISGEQVFKYNSAQVIPQGSPTSITLTGSVTGTGISITSWKYQTHDGSGNTGWATYPNSTASNTLVVNAGDDTFYNDQCLIKLETNDANVYDLHTITKLRDGTPGTSNIAAVLTNEDQMLPADKDGNITSYDGAQSQLIIYEGSNVVTDNWTIALSSSGSLTYQVSTNGTNWNASSTSGSHWTHVKVTSMSSDVASITFTASKSGETPLHKTFSIVRVKTGADGKNPIIYSLELSSLAINATAGNNPTFTPSTLTATAYKRVGNEAKQVASDCRFKVYAGAAQGSPIDASIQDQSSRDISSCLSDGLATGYLTVQLYASGGTSLLDTQTVAFTSDGAAGEQGPQGPAGNDSINVILGNQADVIPCAHDNTTAMNMTVASGNPITIPFSAYKGTTKVACTVATPAKLFGSITATVTQATASSDGSIVYSIPAGTTVPAESGTISLTFTCQSRTINMQYRWTRSTASADGINAVILQLLTPLGTVFTNGDGDDLTIEGVLYDGATDASSSATWSWAKYTGNGYTPISGATSRTITVHASDVNSFASYRCQASYQGQASASKTYTAYVSVIDKTDPLQLSVLSSIGDQIINGLGVGAFYVIVYRNGVEIDPIKSTRFLTAAPSSATTGDYYYHVDSANKTVTLKKYSGSSWSNAPSSDLPSGTYAWTHMDKDGNAITASGLSTSGKVIYIDGTLFDKKMVSTVRVTI